MGICKEILVVYNQTLLPLSTDVTVRRCQDLNGLGRLLQVRPVAVCIAEITKNSYGDGPRETKQAGYGRSTCGHGGLK
jgi:hypothetical protein